MVAGEAHDQIGDLDAGLVHWVAPVTRRARLNRTATATNTVAVWISAIAADSSELELSQELTIAGVITLEFGPIRKIDTPSSRTEAIELTRYAKQVGASCGLSVVPYYNKPTQEGLYRHFTALAEATDRPILVYNIPYRTGVNLGSDVGAVSHRLG